LWLLNCSLSCDSQFDTSTLANPLQLLSRTLDYNNTIQTKAMKLFRSPSTKHAAADTSSSAPSPSQKSPRRRNFRFLRSVDQKRRESVSTQKRARAHAKELAMAYNLTPASDTPNSTTSSNVNLLSRPDVSTPSPRKQNNDDFFDPFGNGAPQNDPFANASVEEDLFAINKPPEIKSSLDQHFATGPNEFRSKEPTASTIDSFDHSSISSDLDLFANNNNNGKPAKLDEFMGRQQQRGRNVVSNPSGGGGGGGGGGINAMARRKMRSNQVHKRQTSDSTSVASTASADESQYSSPPDSPRGIQRAAATQSRKASFEQNRGKSAGSSGGSLAGGSVAGSVMTTTTFQSQSSFVSSGSAASGDPNLWDSSRPNGGFTFDAFGLDESQVQQDVDFAVQELVTEGHRGFSFFQNDSDNDSEFQAGPWDSPNVSRMSIASASSDTDGFDDGFRTQPQHGGGGGRNRSPTPPMRGQTPPRWEKNKKGNNTRGAGFADFDNPWKHDSLGSASKPPAAGSEIGGSEAGGSSSVFGGTKSAFVPSSSSPFQEGFQSSLFSSNLSDHGGTTGSSSSGYLSRLQAQRAGNNSDDEMQDDLAKEFAQEFVKRISPRHNVASPTSERSFGDFSEQSSYTEYDDEHSHSEYDDQHDVNHPTPLSSSTTPKSKFRNFKDRYESSKVQQSPSSSTPAGQSYRTLAAQKEQGASTPEGSNKPSYGSLCSSYNAAKSTAVASSPVPASEEKKEEEDDRPSTSMGTSKRGTLKAKWNKFENKTRPPVTHTHTHRPVVEDDDVSVRALSSDTPRHAAGRSSQGFGRKSDINKSAFSRLREESSPQEAPSTPSFQNVTMRRSASKSKLEDLMDDESVMQNSATPSPPSRPVSYRQQQQQQQSFGGDSGHSRPTTPVADEDEPPVERKLTYRERREMELKKKAEEQANTQDVQKKDPPKKDVAAMIRRRIAANKAKAAEQAKQQHDEVADFRSRLKPTKSSSPEQKPAEEDSTPLPEEEAQMSSAPEQAQTASAPEQELPPRPSMGSPLNQYVQQGNSQKKGSLLDHETVVSLQAENADLVARLKALEEKLAAQEGSPVSGKSGAPAIDTDAAPQDPHKMLGGMLAKRLSPTAKASSSSDGPVDTKKVLGNMLAARGASTGASDTPQDPKKMLGAMLAGRGAPPAASSGAPQDPKKMLGAMLAGRGAPPGGASAAPQDPKKMLGGLLAKRAGLPTPPKQGGGEANSSGRPALKDDPKYEKYFKMMKVGMPKDVVKHAMQRDGLDPDILDADPNQPAGLPLKEDPKYQKYFKMLKMGIPMIQVKHALERDGLNPEVMDQDHNLPASAAEKKLKKKKIPKKKDTHRRARLHWNTLTKVVRGSIWGKIETDDTLSCIDIDEDEFQNLFQAEIGNKDETPKNEKLAKKGPAVRVIDAKRANNGGIILARIKMSHDEMADAVDRMDTSSFSSGQIESIIEYLPTKEERDSLEKYMVDGGLDAAAKFNGLCECEKFMVSMMTVKHAKRKINALLFKLQFETCLDSIATDADMIDQACEELKHSSRLRQLLGIVLQFGNRLNSAGSGEQKNKAGAFTLDSLLKLNQAKAFDKKTTFLHYIVLIVQRNNELLLNFDDDIQGVIKAERVYWDQCVSDLEDVENQLENVRRISLYEAKKKAGHRTPKKKDGDDDSIGDDKGMSLEEEVAALRSTQTGLFTLSAIKGVSALRDKVDTTAAKFDKLLEFFGEHESATKKQPQELFAIFSKFARDFKKAKEEVARKQKKKEREERKKQRAMEGSSSKPKHVGNENRSQPRTQPRTETVAQAAARKAGEKSSTAPDAKSSAKASFRDQGRHHRLRQVQNNARSHHNGSASQPVASNGNAESAPSNRPPPLAPAPSPSNQGYNPAGTPSSKPPMSSTTTPTGSRNLMRNRRRLMEERKKRSTPTDTSSPWRSPQTAS